MREILFRGKGLDNGEWVEGFYHYTNWYDSHTFEMVGTHYWILPIGGQDAIQVDPETVGQYTGLVDKNGNKIFEGDIVRTQPFSDRPYSKKAKFKQHIGVVEYHVGHFKSMHDTYEQDYEAIWRVNIKDYDGYGCCNWSAFFKCEVMGNIHDNPELLDQ